ncbi:SDR family oxidoreductase [Bradyrhizobium sp. Pear77]|uniref:SDR family NAD(P)-dependent oxidoreductase n=1 Tax=Bradyrhizobium altum TaxID=1571202 RepID=UPI001E4D9C83|nr:SDR family NAD(P)-dependent oxidoreductase [Bradyrhizobium altum]MCC8957353.1 SDR family oxidoreductase [Bradyrhizobium altum]
MKTSEKAVSGRPRVALVTGAAQGLGQGFATRLAKDKFHVIALDRVACVDTLAAIEAAGGKATDLCVDLSDPKAISDGVAKTLSHFGAVDVLVNNAGLIPNVEFEKIDLAQWRALMAVNLEAPFLLCQSVIPTMKSNGYGRIINVASNTVGLKIAGFVHYVASKGGLIGMTRALASEYGGFGITANAVAPGLTRTHGMMDPARRGPGGVTTDQEIAHMKTLQAIPRGGEVDDLVGAVSFLASDDSAFITGQTLVVDGGLWRI